VSFAEQVEAMKSELLAPILDAGRLSLDGSGSADPQQLLQIALANEINVSELAALWMPTTREVDVKLAFARQAGDEAGHFQLVAGRLAALGFDVASYQPPAANPMFQYLRGLTTTVERIAAGLVTLEALAYGVNENFIAWCRQRGDAETVAIYEQYIQPDERAHQQLGQQLLAKHAATPELQATALATIRKLAELASTSRAAAE